MKKNNKLVTILLASSLLLPGIAPLATGVTSVSAATETAANQEFENEYVAFTDQVVRFQAVDNATEVAFLEEGDKAEFVAKIDLNWFKVKVGGVVGYVERGNMTSEENYNNKDYKLQNVSTSVVAKDDKDYVVAVKTPLRTGNANRFRPIKSMNRASEIEYKGTSADGQWFKVEHEGTLGFVHRADVTTVENFEAGGEAEDRILDSEAKLEGSLRLMVDSSIRTQPGKQYRVIDGVNRNEMVTYVGTVRGNKDWLRVKLEDKTEGYIYRGDVTKQGAVEVEEGLVVESVSAINSTGVDVVFAEGPEEDTDDVTIEVLDNEGNIVEVEPITIGEGDKEASFDFVDEQEDQEGVWTIGGVEWDFDLRSNLADFLGAADEVKLLAALNKLDIENVEEDHLPKYFEAKEKLDVDEDTITLEDVQEMIDDVNKDAMTKDEKKAAVKAVADNKDNQVQLLNALKDGFKKVNPDWISDYQEVLEDVDKDTPFKDVQDAIYGVNQGKLDKDITEELDKDTLLEEKALIEDYAERNDEGEFVKSQNKTKLENIEIQLAVIEVREATTANRLKSALTKLDELVDKDAKFMAKDGDYKGYVDANAKLYFEYTESGQDDAYFKGIVNSNGAKDLIETVNNNVDEEQAKIDSRITYDYTMDHSSDSVIGYGVNFKVSFKEADVELEEFVVELYKGNSLLATVTGTEKLADLLNSKDMGAPTTAPFDILGDYENDEYWTTDGWEGKAFDIPTKVKASAVFSDREVVNIDEKVTVTHLDSTKEKIALKLVNDAETAEEVKVALDGLADADYLNVTVADRIFIAEQVLDARDDKEDKEFGSIEDVTGDTGAIKTATGARTAAIDKVNDLDLDGNLTDIAKALLEVGHDSLTGTWDGEEGTVTANDTAIADAFITSLEFDEKGDITPQFRSIAAIRAAIDAVL